MEIRKSLVVLVFVPFLFYVACNKTDLNDGKTVIHYLTGPDIGGASKEIIARFEKLNPAIGVEMIEGPAATNIRENMYGTAFVFMDVIWVPKFASQGWLKPLDGWFGLGQRKEFLSGDIEGSLFEGKIYRVPVQSDGGMLYYRKDLLEKYGLAPPKTWGELVAAAKTIQNPPKLWGFVFQGKQYEGLVCNFLEFVWGNGGRLIDAQGAVHIDSPAAVEALAEMVDAVHKDKIAPKGVLTYQEEEARHMFQEGKAVFMRNWPYAWNLLEADGSPVKGKVGITTMVRGPRGRQGAATLGGWGYGISAFSKNPEAAWKFIQFATSQESQKLNYLRGGIIPTRKALFKDPDIIEKSPHYEELYNVLAKARPRPAHFAYARISDTLQIHLSAALSGQSSPEEALKAAAKEIRRYIRK